MLGAQMENDFSKLNINNKFQIYFSSRKRSKKKIFFDVLNKKSYKNIKDINPHYIINCIGLINQNSINSFKSNTECLKINAMFPMYLSNNFKNSKIIHISSDGVFDGVKEII